MNLKAKKSFSSGYVGNVSPGQVLYDVPSHVAVHFVENGLCEFAGGTETGPLKTGPAQPSLSSPAGQALPSNSATTSDSDSKPAPAGSSRSTPASAASKPVTPSMGTTARSGASTTTKRQRKPKK